MDSKSEARDDQEQKSRAKLWTPECDKLLRRWKKQIAARQRIHNDISRQYKQRHYYLGIPGIILGMIVASGTFSTFANCDTCGSNNDTASAPSSSSSLVSCQANEWIRLVMGIVGIVSSIVAGLMTFLDYQSAAEDHKSASDEYDSMYRQLDTTLLLPGYARGDVVATLQSLRSQYDSIAKRSPTLPKKYDLELTYEVVANGSVQTRGPVPPQPAFFSSTGGNEPKLTSRTTSQLKEFFKTDASESEIKEKTIHDLSNLIKIPSEKNDIKSSDDDKEVCINFDPDDPEDRAFAPTSSLQAALAFEMGRMDGLN